ncbi:YqhR family membrane protein [Bacillus thuringiensis]
MGQCVRNCLYGTNFDFNCFLYKAFLAKFEGILPGMIYGLFWWALLFFGIGLLAPTIKSALHLPKETIVTTICIFILYGVFIAYSVSYAVNTNKAEREAEEKTNYSNK